MYINVNLPGGVHATVSVVSVPELLQIERNINGLIPVIVGVGDDQVARVVAEGDTQVVRAGVEADRAETEADRATAQADEIKAVGVVSPVTTVPLLPGNVPGTPTVTYDSGTGLFTYGIPAGQKGEPAQVVTPTGSVTIAELNALVSDPIPGAGYWMLDTGTVTYGDPDVIVTAPNEVLIWLAEGYFFNIGILSVNLSWDTLTGVTVAGQAPANGDDLFPTNGGTLSGDLTVGDGTSGSGIRVRSTGTSSASYELQLANGIRVGHIYIDKASGIVNIRRYDITGNDLLTNLQIDDNGNVSVNGSAPTENNHLTRKDYVDAVNTILDSKISDLLARIDILEGN